MTAQPKKMTGMIKALHGEKGFGFIRGADDGVEYFFHRSSAADFAALEPGMVVRFVPAQGAKGPRADSVEIV